MQGVQTLTLSQRHFNRANYKLLYLHTGKGVLSPMALSRL